jgi:hypothetical protein
MAQQYRKRASGYPGVNDKIPRSVCLIGFFFLNVVIRRFPKIVSTSEAKAAT